MSDVNPADQIASAISSLESDVEDLHSKARLSSLRDRVEDIGSSTEQLPQRIKELRSRNYAFEKDLEDRAKDLAKRWNANRSRIENQITKESDRLTLELRPIESRMTQLLSRRNNISAAKPIVNELEPKVSNMESKISAAESTVSGMFDELENQINQLKRHLDQLEWMLEQISEATFTLLPTESGIKAVKAVWVQGRKEEKDDPEGILYLTDQRLLFEQKEKVATKKVLFVTTKSEMVQELGFEGAVAAIDDVEAKKEGVFKNEDHLYLKFSSSATVTSAHLHLDGQDCQDWLALINRAKTQDFEADRAIEIEEEVLEKVKAAPTTCPSCGGAITKPVLRGQDSITCEFCGAVIRL